jgi:hypothetical protein
MRGDEEKCRDAGCSGFLTKPIDMDLLVRTIARGKRANVRRRWPVADAKLPAPACGGGKRSPPRLPRTSPPLACERRHTEATGVATCPANVSNRACRATIPEFCQIIVEFVDRLHEQLGAMEQAWGKQDLSRTGLAGALAQGIGRHSRLCRTHRASPQTRTAGYAKNESG